MNKEMCAKYHTGDSIFLNSSIRDGDTEKIEELRALAEAGDVSAQHKLGFMYYSGTGVPQNLSESAHWYRLAASQGHVVAQNIIGVAYAEGLGVSRDRMAAYMWFGFASDQEHPEARYNRNELEKEMSNDQIAKAQFKLGFAYDTGEGVPCDVMLAHAWYNLAAARGNEDAQYCRDALVLNMDDQQLEETQNQHQNQSMRSS